MRRLFEWANIPEGKRKVYCLKGHWVREVSEERWDDVVRRCGDEWWTVKFRSYGVGQYDSQASATIRSQPGKLARTNITIVADVEDAEKMVPMATYNHNADIEVRMGVISLTEGLWKNTLLFSMVKTLRPRDYSLDTKNSVFFFLQHINLRARWEENG